MIPNRVVDSILRTVSVIHDWIDNDSFCYIGIDQYGYQYVSEDRDKFITSTPCNIYERIAMSAGLNEFNAFNDEIEKCDSLVIENLRNQLRLLLTKNYDRKRAYEILKEDAKIVFGYFNDRTKNEIVNNRTKFNRKYYLETYLKDIVEDTFSGGLFVSWGCYEFSELLKEIDNLVVEHIMEEEGQ